jgi:hypothetical protein
MGNTKDTETIEFQEDINSQEQTPNVQTTLEKARIYHEKYLLRNNSSDLESAVNRRQTHSWRHSDLLD